MSVRLLQSQEYNLKASGQVETNARREDLTIGSHPLSAGSMQPEDMKTSSTEYGILCVNATDALNYLPDETVRAGMMAVRTIYGRRDRVRVRGAGEVMDL